MSGLLHVSFSLPRVKSPGYPFNRGLVGPQRRSGCFGKKNLVPAGNPPIFSRCRLPYSRGKRLPYVAWDSEDCAVVNLITVREMTLVFEASVLSGSSTI